MILEWYRRSPSRLLRRFRRARPAPGNYARPEVLPLEDRCLLSILPTGFQLPDPHTVVSAITTTADGSVWFVETGGKIGRLASRRAVQELPLAPGARPTDLAAGSGGNIWIADNGRDSIDLLTPSGAIVEYHLPAGDAPPLKLAANHDSVWFIESGRGVLGRMSLNGQFTD